MEDGLSAATAASGAALLKVKKERLPASDKRAERREKKRLKYLAAKEATAAVEERERRVAIEAAAARDLIATQAAARAVLLLGGLIPSAVPELVASAASSASSAKGKPPRSASPVLSTASPAGHPATAGISRLGSREASPEMGTHVPVPAAPVAPLDLKVTPAASRERVAPKSRSMSAAGTAPEPRVLDFEEPSLTPSDPAFFNEDDGDCFMGDMSGDMADMIFTGPSFVNVEDAETQDPTGLSETQPAEGISIDEEPLDFDEEHAALVANLKKRNACTTSYTDMEDKVLCESWMTVSQNATIGAQ